MAEFSNREEFQRWVDEKPGEWTMVIAVCAFMVRVASRLSEASESTQSD